LSQLREVHLAGFLVWRDVVHMAKMSLASSPPVIVPGWREVLAKIPLFAGFSGDELDRLAACAHERRMRRGEVLLRTGDPGQSMMIVILGEVRVQLAGVAGQQQIVSTLGAGAVIGEIALFDGKSRTADVVAATNGRLLTIDRAPLLALMAEEPRKNSITMVAVTKKQRPREMMEYG